MIIKLLPILPLFFGLPVHTQTDKGSASGFESLEELGEFFSRPFHRYNTKGKENPKFLMDKIDNCLLSVNIESNESIKLTFVDKETINRVYKNRRNIDIKNLPKGFLCNDMTSGTKIVSIGEKFLFDSDGHHVSVFLELLEINKEQAVFEYTNSGFFGYMNYSSTEKGMLNLELSSIK